MVERLRERKLPTIRPAQGEERGLLIKGCLTLINRPPENFDSDAWRQFTLNMVNLLGGGINRRGNVMTPWLTDKEGSCMMRFSSLAKPGITGERLIEETRIVIIAHGEFLQAEPCSVLRLETRRTFMPDESITRLSSAHVPPEKKMGLRGKAATTLATNTQLGNLAQEIFQAFTANSLK